MKKIMMKKILRSVGQWLSAIFTEGNPGAGPPGSDGVRQAFNRNNTNTLNLP
jgi:hypothetical protein